jgi:hypothetical protein
VLAGQICIQKVGKTKNLARYPADVLWPDGPYAKQAFNLNSKDLAMEAAKAAKQKRKMKWKKRNKN